MQKKVFTYIQLTLLGALAWVIGLKKLIEPDMWWYLKTGEWIVDNGQVPKHDSFSFTFEGVEWINVKWLYEVIVYGFSIIGGPEFTSVFQSIVGLLIVLVLWKIIKLLQPNARAYSFALVIIPVLLASSYRMTARPETISHLFSLLTLYIFFLGKRKNEKLFFLWIPLQILWTNLHEAYAIGVVLMGILLLAEFLESKFLKSPKNFKMQALAFAGAILSIAINPRGIPMILHPLEIFSQLNENNFTMELFSYHTHYFWKQWQTFIFLAVIILLVGVILFSKGKRLKQSLSSTIDKWGFGYVLVLVALGYLGFSAYRNIPFLLFASVPFLTISIDKVLPKKQFLSFAGIGLTMLIYSLIVTDIFYRSVDSKNRYGLQVAPYYNPIGLAETLENLDYSQPHYSDFLTSAYPLYALKGYQSFIDLRDLDVFPQSFFNEVNYAMQSPNYFDEIDSLNGYKFCHLHRTNYPILIRHLQQHKNWKMTHADPISVLFVKNKDDSVHVDVFEPVREFPASTFSKTISKVFNPFYAENQQKLSTDLAAASLYLSTHDYNLALQRIEKAEGQQQYKYLALCLKVDLMIASGFNKNSKKLEETVRLAKELEPENDLAYFKYALWLIKNKNYTEAIKQLSTAIELNPKNWEAYSILADTYVQQARAGKSSLKKANLLWFKFKEKAYSVNPTNRQLAIILATAYCNSNQCKKAQQFLNALPKNLELNNEVIRCRNKCKVK